MSINDEAQKVKENGPEEYLEESFTVHFGSNTHIEGISRKNLLLLIIIMILVGALSFGLGKLSLYEKAAEPVQITPPITISANNFNSGEVLGEVDQGSLISPGGGEVVGSRNGTKYHFPWCSGAQRISEENLVIFESVDAARAQGYTPAANCKGLQ